MKIHIVILASLLLSFLNFSHCQLNSEENNKSVLKLEFLQNLLKIQQQDNNIEPKIVTQIQYLISQTEENEIIDNQSKQQASFLRQSQQQKQANNFVDLKEKNCLACKVAITGVHGQNSIKQKVQDTIVIAAKYLCGVQWELYPVQVCDSTIEEFEQPVMDAIWDHYISTDFLCPALDFCAPTYEKMDIDLKVEEILKDKPAKEQLIPKQQNVYQFLHFSDVHTDDKYSTKFKYECEDPSCCINTAGLAETEEEQAGFWGTITNCDLPTRTFEKAMQFIKNHLPHVKYGLWTGDNTNHSVWNQSKEKNVSNTSQQTKVVKDTIPDLKMFPIMGNHESFPVNMYNMYDNKEENFNKFFADLWQDWIGEGAAQQLTEEGFYESVITPFENGNTLKIIALNSQAGDTDNFNLIRNPTDPKSQLEKLRSSLQQSEDDDQAVYLLFHIPTSNSMAPYSKIILALVDRYSYNIRGIFSGHYHTDEFQLFYSHSKPEEVVAVNWIAPSVTTYNTQNPSFRLLEVDGDTFQVLNIHQYRLDLNYWNQFSDINTELLFEKAYEFVSEYSLSNIWDLQNLQSLRKEIKTNLSIYNKYVTNLFAGNYEKSDIIDESYYCQINSSPIEKALCNGRSYIPSITEVLGGPWIQKIKQNSTEQSNQQTIIE